MTGRSRPVPHRGGVDRRRHTVDHRFARRRAVPHHLQAGVPSSSSSAAAVPAYAAKLQPELEQLAKDMLVSAAVIEVRSPERGDWTTTLCLAGCLPARRLIRAARSPVVC